jgi:hypothetical protein
MRLMNFMLVDNTKFYQGLRQVQEIESQGIRETTGRD